MKKFIKGVIKVNDTIGKIEKMFAITLMIALVAKMQDRKSVV